jgi:predicted phage-related endonuclease
MIIKNYIQGSQEWLDMRKNHIMASEAPIIMGYHRGELPCSCGKRN